MSSDDKLVEKVDQLEKVFGEYIKKKVDENEEKIDNIETELKEIQQLLTLKTHKAIYPWQEKER